ncbi:ABATE domain-containing protein [Actinospica robiniae]|uniref:ABATE domain-containing protein n=1 Tax=Actinospica robiniae TaxID=304901 RepID=UPI0004171EF9|nr:ABATE domain-containing protein [Actinospica robiniae]
MRRWLALELAGTIRHDGNGGVADDLLTPADLAGWIRAQDELLSPQRIEPGLVESERALSEVLAVRTAARALFARVVAPAPPSRADAGRLPNAADALAALNCAAARVQTALSLEWPVEGEPSLRFTDESVDPVDRLTALLAREAMLFLADADSGRLAACNAPRCVRYFLKDHGRQEYCKPSCSNRARAARHYRRHEGSAEGGSVTA